MKRHRLKVFPRQLLCHFNLPGATTTCEDYWPVAKTLRDAEGDINSVAFNFNGMLLAAGGDDKKVRIYRNLDPWHMDSWLSGGGGWVRSRFHKSMQH